VNEGKPLTRGTTMWTNVKKQGYLCAYPNGRGLHSSASQLNLSRFGQRAVLCPLTSHDPYVY